MSSPAAHSPEFLQYFWQLADLNATARSAAAGAIIDHVAIHPQLQDYTVKRLIRGLSSSRDAARQGFSSTLTQLLMDCPGLDMTELLSLLEDITTVSNSQKGMEQRELMFGRLFGYLAFQRSKRLSSDQLEHVLDQFIVMSQWKKWFRETCFEAMLTLMVDLDGLTSNMPHVLAKVQTQVFKDTSIAEWNIDQLQLALGLVQMDAETWEGRLFGSSGLELAQIAQHPAIVTASVTYPRVHRFWAYFCHAIWNSIESGSPCVWTTLVESTIKNGTHEQKGMLFNVIQEQMLPKISKVEHFSWVCPPQLLMGWYTIASSPKTYLNACVSECFNRCFELYPHWSCSYFQSMYFLNPRGLLNSAAADDDEKDQEVLQEDERLELKEMRTRQVEKLQMFYLDQILCQGKRTQNQAMIRECFQFCFHYGWFHSTVCSIHIESYCREKAHALYLLGNHEIIQRLQKVVVNVKQQPMTGDESLTILGSDIPAWYGAQSQVQGPVSPLTSLEEQKFALTTMSKWIAKYAKNRRKNVTKIAKKKTPGYKIESLVMENGILETFELVLIYLQLEYLSLNEEGEEEDETSASTTREEFQILISDLVQALNQFLSINALAASSTMEEQRSEKEHATKVFMDVVLNLLTTESTALRSILSLLFKQISPWLESSSCLAELFRITCPVDLKTDEDEEGLDSEEDSDDSDSDSDSDGEENDDEPEQELAGVNDEEEEEEEEIVLSSELSLSEILLDQDEETEARGDAEDMKREDQALSKFMKILLQQKNKRQNNKKIALQNVHYQLRVLELLELFTSARGSSESNVECLNYHISVLAYLNAHSSSTSQGSVLMVQKWLKFWKNFKFRTTGSSTAVVAVPETWTAEWLTLRSYLEKSKVKAVRELTIHFCIQRIQQSGPGNVAVLDMMTGYCHDIMTIKNTKLPILFFDQCLMKMPQWMNEISWSILMPLLASDTVAQFMKCQALRWCQALLKAELSSGTGKWKVHERTLQQLVVQHLQPSAQLSKARRKLVTGFCSQLIKTMKKNQMDGESFALELENMTDTKPQVVKQFITLLRTTSS